MRVLSTTAFVAVLLLGLFLVCQVAAAEDVPPTAAPKDPSAGAETSLSAEYASIAASLLPHQKKIHLQFWSGLGVPMSQRFKDVHGVTNAEKNRTRSARGEQLLQVEILTEKLAAGGLPRDVLNLITKGNGVVLFEARDFQAILAEIPASLLDPLAALSSVRSIKPFDKFKTNKIDTSEGVPALRVDLIRTLFPDINGQGVKIGVISDSVSYLTSVQSTGDLPSSVTVLPGQGGSWFDSGEGTAMLEIIYDLAPGASLYFATAGNSMNQMAQNILDLANAGCQIIVDDVSFFLEPVFEDGVIAQAVDRVAARGVAYFSAAGNSGGKYWGSTTWEGDYVGGAWNGGFEIPANATEEYLDALVFTSNQTYLEAWDALSIIVNWANPVEAPETIFHIFAFDSDWRLVAASVDGNSSTLLLDLGFTDYKYYIVVARVSGPPCFIHIALIPFTSYAYFDPSTPSGHIWGHAAARGALAIGAVKVPFQTSLYDLSQDPSSITMETFSSRGPRRIFFEDGSAITPGDFTSTGGSLRLKPDFTSVDGVSCATPGFNPFFGTSAAAPHAAALAALALSAFPEGIDLETLFAAFRSSALDIYTPGWDQNSGNGILDAVSIFKALGVSSECPSVTEGGAFWSSKCAGGVQQGVCLTGFSSNATRLCQSRGVWGPISNPCAQPNCPAIMRQSVYWEEAPINTIATGVCYPGRVGAPQLHCMANGKWNTSFPITPCVQASCPTITEDNATFLNITAPATRIGTCAPGYLGIPVRFCQLDGTWGDFVNRCKPVRCPLQESGNAVWESTPFSTIATGACKTGYVQDAAPPRRPCDAQGTWGSVDFPCVLP